MSKNVTSHPKIIWEWKKPLGDKNKPYAYRWRLDFYFFSFRIHKWLCSDDTRAYHSHPTNMLIFILKGGYRDYTPKGVTHYGYKSKTNTYGKRFRIIWRNTKHYIKLNCSPTWSLIFTWGSPQRWSFWDKTTGKKLNRDKYFLEKGHHIYE